MASISGPCLQPSASSWLLFNGRPPHHPQIGLAVLSSDPETLKQVWDVARGVALFWFGGVVVNLLTPQRSWDRLRAALRLSLRRYRIYRLKCEIKEVDAAKAYPAKAVIAAIWDLTTVMGITLALVMAALALLLFRVYPEKLASLAPIFDTRHYWIPVAFGMHVSSLFNLAAAFVRSSDIDGFRAFLVRRLERLEG